jgi:hypothetical protein
MTVINQNSISGITSITAASGSVQIFNSDGSSGSLTDLAGVNVSGVVTATRYRVSAGSTAAPAITPPDDTNTGIFFPSADTIAFGEGGTEVARFDSSGRLGVGLENPSVKVHISDSVTSVGSTGTEVLKIANTRVNTGSSAVALRFVNNEISGTNQYTRAQIAAEYDGTSNNNGRLMFATADTNGVLQERARIDGSGRFGIGTQSPVSALNVSVADGGNITISSTNDGHTSGLAFGDTSSNSSGRISYDHFTNAMRFDTNGSERVRLDSSGRLLVGTSSTFDTNCTLQVNNQYAAQFFRWGADGCEVYIGSARGSQGSPSGLINGDNIGGLNFRGYDGSAYRTGASIAAVVDAGVGVSDFPSRLVFSTTADGASSPTERMRIDSAGSMVLASGSAFVAPYVYNTTTATATNVNVDATGFLRRSTSSIKYKTNVETIQDQYADAILGCRPVWYQSTCEGVLLRKKLPKSIRACASSRKRRMELLSLKASNTTALCLTC